MERLKRLSLYIIVSGYLGIVIMFEQDLINTSTSLIKLIPLAILFLGSGLLFYSNYKIHKSFTKKNIAFGIFMISLSLMYIQLFIFSKQLDTLIGDSGCMYLMMVFGGVFAGSLGYLIIHSKLVRKFLIDAF